MAKIKKGKLGPTKGMSVQVNPTYSSPGGDVNKAKPATRPNVQLNPTASAGKSQTKSGARLIAARKEASPTYSVANKNKETSKGTSGPKLMAKKSKVGAPEYKATGGKAVSPNRANFASNKGGADVKGYQAPTRNEEGPVNASGPRSRYDDQPKRKMTVKRLSKLGY